MMIPTWTNIWTNSTKLKKRRFPRFRLVRTVIKPLLSWMNQTMMPSRSSWMRHLRRSFSSHRRALFEHGIESRDLRMNMTLSCNTHLPIQTQMQPESTPMNPFSRKIWTGVKSRSMSAMLRSRDLYFTHLALATPNHPPPARHQPRRKLQCLLERNHRQLSKPRALSLISANCP